MKKIVLLAFLSLLLSTAMIWRFIRPVKSDWTWTETICIRADGSIYPDTAPISTVDNVIYTLTDNIVGDVPKETSAILVERDNIVVDGAGYTVQGNRSGYGITLSLTNNVTLKNVEVKNFSGNGIRLWASHNNVLSGNTVSNNINWGGIALYYSSNNVLTGNTVSSNIGAAGIVLSFSSNNTIAGNTASSNIVAPGIRLHSSSNNTIAGNTASNNGYGIFLGISSNNTLFHNNFINNTQQVYDYSWDDPGVLPSINTWDDGYPSGGNYWSNYTGVDLLDGGDGIGDSAHAIDADNQDNYPLMGPISFFNAGTWDEVTYYVHTVSNSTVSDFHFSESNKLVSFNVTGLSDTLGFCRVAIPRELLWCEDIFDWTIRVNETSVPVRIQEYPDYTYIYFTYSHSVQNVKIYGTQVIPEFPAWTSMFLMLIVLTVATVIYKRRLLKTPIH